MSHEIPPIIERPKTLIGVGLRELVVLSLGGLLALSVFLFPIGIVLKIGLAVLLAGLSTALAFGRDPRSGKTLEGSLRDRWQYAGRARFFQRGAGPLAAAPLPPDSLAAAARPAGPVFARVRPLPLGLGLWLRVGSLAMLAALLSWVWLGGVAEIAAWFAPGFGN